ncbi:MAG TPA: hypothetical protein VIV60_06240 [Polyangiaceae bacterium]
MGKLFEARQRIDAAIQQKGLDATQVRGAIGLRAGMLLGLILQSTPDDPEKLRRLTEAAKEVLGLDLTRK